MIQNASKSGTIGRSAASNQKRAGIRGDGENRPRPSPPIPWVMTVGIRCLVVQTILRSPCRHFRVSLQPLEMRATRPGGMSDAIDSLFFFAQGDAVGIGRRSIRGVVRRQFLARQEAK